MLRAGAFDNVSRNVGIESDEAASLSDGQSEVYAAGFLSPHCFIRASKVVGLTPISSAAPSGPLIFQLAAWRTTRRLGGWVALS
jgi:hypothetical protein